MHVCRWSNRLLTSFHPETCRSLRPCAAEEQHTNWPPQQPALEEASAGHDLHVRCVFIKENHGQIINMSRQMYQKGGLNLLWSSKKHEHQLQVLKCTCVCDLTVQLVPFVGNENFSGVGQWRPAQLILQGVCWHCNTESLQGSSFSLEEELPGPDHRLESVFQNLRLGPLGARQQRQQ